jgi:RNA polymerase nonessential primary-like sigma factor
VEGAIMNQRRMVRLPTHKAKALNLYVRAASQLAQTLDHTPTCEEIALKIDKPIEEIRSLLAFSYDTTSLDAPVAKDGTQLLVDHLADETNVDPEILLEKADLERYLDVCFHQLNEKEQAVVARRFGLYGHEKQGLEEVGKVIGLTRERVRQIQLEAIKKLRAIVSEEATEVKKSKEENKKKKNKKD